MEFHQARWNEQTIFERSAHGKVGHLVPKADPEEIKSVGDVLKLVPKKLLRENPPLLPEVSEVEVIRHYTRLSQQTYGVTLGTYPLGSCTMKYNPKICDFVTANPKFQSLHPYQDESTVQGILQILYELSQFIAEITGMSKVSLQPAAGAHGELTGTMIIRAYQKSKGELDKRKDIIIPDSAHGTNPASAAMAGFNTVVVPSDASDGTVSIEALKATAGPQTAGLMITNPNTLGVFEKNILEVSKIVHDAGGLVYYDGANANAILGKTRPGDMGFDIVHINVHKTLATPHGGGGPGAGPCGVVKSLEKFLPIPTVEYDGKKYCLDYDRPHSIGKMRGFYGNISVLLRSYAYILAMGAEGLKRVAELSTLNANYICRKVLKAKGYTLPYGPENPRKHESVISAEQMSKETGVRALNVAKNLLDYGLHAPTNYFPVIVHEALMIEPTESESKEELDKFINSMIRISEDAYSNPQKVLSAPQNTTVTKIDEVKASHPKTLCINWKSCLTRSPEI
jgi:glycine dehydrogenase subunit 2